MTWLKRPYRPVPVSDVLLVFPGDIEHLMPDPETIPDEYRNSSHPLYKLVSEFIFTQRTPGDLTFTPRIDLDYEMVVRHLSAIAGSYQPKHQDKQAALTLLFDIWFPELAQAAMNANE